MLKAVLALFRSWLGRAAFFFLAFSGSAQDFNNDGKPDILWHRSPAGDVGFWLMNGTNLVRVATTQRVEDPSWRIAGTGFFNRGSDRDILWENEKTGELGVWLMDGTRFKSAEMLKLSLKKPWKIAGADDFNRDGKADLIWENRESGQRLLWLMNGLEQLSEEEIKSEAGPEWRICASGQFNSDAIPDLVLRHQRTGQIAIWHMSGLRGAQIASAKIVEPGNTDLDWKITGAGDFSVPRDGKTDLLLRHAVLGLNMVLFMSGHQNTGSAFLQSTPDTDWRMASQESGESSWRIERERRKQDFTTIHAATSNNAVFLDYSLPSNPGFGAKVQRKKAGETNWAVLAPNHASGEYTDASIQIGERYEYQVSRQNISGFTFGASEFIMAGDRIRPDEKRGRVLVLVDETLKSQIDGALDDFEQDLIGDGWEPVRRAVPRHDEKEWARNPPKIAAVKSLILSEYERDPANTKAIILVGHVAVPYSGFTPTDGHDCGWGGRPDHRGAWPADLFYTDVDTLDWGDKAPAYKNCDFEIHTNLPGDGKFDQDTYPVHSVMKLMIGRIDFAKLSLLTTHPLPGRPKRSEADLIKHYLAKNHRYRHGELPWQSQPPEIYERALVFGHFYNQDYVNSLIFRMSIHAATAAFAGENRLAVGDCLTPKKTPSLFGFIAGPGMFDRINPGAVIENSSASISTPGHEPNTAFTVLLASYMGDWNGGENNLPRSLLAAPNFGLASMWTRDALWRLDAPGLGEPLGMALVRMVNGARNYASDRLRELNILGDPTLRVHILPPPSQVKGSIVKGAVSLSWKKPESASLFHVYRATQAAGPFTRLSDAPSSEASFEDPAPLSGTNIYMIRALALTQAGCGSYTNLSQGVTVTLKN